MTRPGDASLHSQHLTVCLECEDELATAWCEECRTSLCEECDLHQHHSKSLRREHVRMPIQATKPPAVSTPRTGLLSKAFAAEGNNWGLAKGSDIGDESADDVSTLTGNRPSDFGAKLEGASSHHSGKSKRKHKKKKRGKSKGHEGQGQHEKEGAADEDGQEVDGGILADKRSESCDIEGKAVEKDGGSEESSSLEQQAERPVWKKLKSSLKGSHQVAGAGPRPTLHVHWSPDVRDITADSHSPSFGSPRRFVPFISNRRKKYAEKHHKKHKGSGDHPDKRGKGKGRKGHEAQRSSGSKKPHLERAPSTGLGDASESADSDTFSPRWPRDSSDKSEGTSDESSFEDKPEPRSRTPEVHLKLPESLKGKELGEERREGLVGEQEVDESGSSQTESPLEAKKPADAAVVGIEARVLQAVPFGEIVSSSGADDSGEESMTEDDSMAGGMDIDSSETEMLAPGEKEQPPGRSWKWFERFMGKKKTEEVSGKSSTAERGRPARGRKGSFDQGANLKKEGPISRVAEEKSSLSPGVKNKGSGSRASQTEAPSKPDASGNTVVNAADVLDKGRRQTASDSSDPQGGDVLQAVCEWEAAIRRFRTEGGRQALRGEAHAWDQIAQLQKQGGDHAAAGRSFLAAARGYKNLGMEDELGVCLQRARELTTSGEEGDVSDAGRVPLTTVESESETERLDGPVGKAADGDADGEDSTRGNRGKGLHSGSLGRARVYSGPGGQAASSANPHPVQSSNTKDLEQDVVYSSKKGSKKKGKAPAAKSSAVATKSTPNEASNEVPQSEQLETKAATAETEAHVSSHLVTKRTAGETGNGIAGVLDTAAAIARSRQSGAAAIASGDAEKGRTLLVGALVAARKGGVKTEEARCLRLLADSQANEEQRVRALESAVQGLRVSGLKLEEAEALYRLADAKLNQYLGNKAAIQAAVAGMPGKEDVAKVESARESLFSAAEILQGADLWQGVKSVPEGPSRDVLSPTRTNRPEVAHVPPRGKFAERYAEDGENSEHRARAGRGIPEAALLKSGGGRAAIKAMNGRGANELRSLRELYGAVCQGVGKASILLGQLGPAKKNFQEALLNKEWTTRHGDEAKKVQEIMGRLPR